LRYLDFRQYMRRDVSVGFVFERGGWVQMDWNGHILQLGWGYLHDGEYNSFLRLLGAGEHAHANGRPNAHSLAHPHSITAQGWRRDAKMMTSGYHSG
jgi:hypothetical protein